MIRPQSVEGEVKVPFSRLIRANQMRRLIAPVLARPIVLSCVSPRCPLKPLPPDRLAGACDYGVNGSNGSSAAQCSHPSGMQYRKLTTLQQLAARVQLMQAGRLCSRLPIRRRLPS